MRKWKAKFKRKFLYLLDNKEYTKIKNGDVTSPFQDPTLYIYIYMQKEIGSKAGCVLKIIL